MNFTEQLRQHGYKLTPQRQIISNVLQHLGGHLTAAQIHTHVQKQTPTIDRATVYRTLNLFQDLHLIHSSRIGGQTIYEITDEEPHHHLVCQQCGHIQQLHDQHLESLVQHLMTEHQFAAQINHLTITGLCQDCWNKS